MPMQAAGITAIIRELDAVTTKLATQRLTGAARLELLRRQAKLGDLREAALAARRRAAASPDR